MTVRITKIYNAGAGFNMETFMMNARAYNDVMQMALINWKNKKNQFSLTFPIEDW